MKTIKILFLTFLLISFSCQDNTEIDEVENLEKTEKLTKIENDRNKLVSESKLLETLNSKKFDFEILNSNVRFDNQDNLMQIDNGEWFQNWDLENNKPANPFFSMKIVENKIILKSKDYFLLGVIPVDFYGETLIRYSLNGKKVVIKYPNISEHFYQTDFFNFNIFYLKGKDVFLFKNELNK